MKNLIYGMDEKYKRYLSDESKMTGTCESISFPESEEEASSTISAMYKNGTKVTIQGGKTGVSGGAVPQGGHIMNMSRMNHVCCIEMQNDGTALMKAEPGLSLEELKKATDSMCRRERMFWPPEPTSSTAVVGGIAATGARGICAYLYGETRKYIEAARLITADGSILDVTSGNQGPLLDSLIGAEGTAGIFTQLTLRLVKEPEERWGIYIFFNSDVSLCSFVEMLQSKKGDFKTASSAIAAIEYLDKETLRMIDDRKSVMTRLKELPDLPRDCSGTIYVELHGKEEGIEELAGMLLELSAEYGCKDEQTWAMSGEEGVRRIRELRYAASEVINAHIDDIRVAEPRITKLVADMSFPGYSFSEILNGFKKDAEEAGIHCCVYGHAGENLLYAELLPENYGKYIDATRLIRRWAQRSADCGGDTVREYGIGKLKKKILDGLLPTVKLETRKRLTDTLDPNHILNF